MSSPVEGQSISSFTFSAGESTAAAKWARRLKTIPGLITAFIVVWLLLPVLLLFAILADLLTAKAFSNTRLVLFGAWWLAMEFLGVAAAMALWLVFAPFKQLSSNRSRRWHSHLQRLWSSGLVAGAKLTIRLRWSVEGVDCLRQKGPLVILARHGSQGDGLLAGALLLKEGRRLRFILKKQLLSDPCLDVVGHRIPNYFVDRDSLNNKDELTNIGLLARDMADDEALIIFPEGTRFSTEKLGKAIAALSETAPTRVKSASELRSVLPPRTAGTLAALAESNADIVICNHVGISDISSLQQLRAAVPLQTQLKFKLWRTPRSEVNQTQFVQWLDAQWAIVDDWVTNNEDVTSPLSTPASFNADETATIIEKA